MRAIGYLTEYGPAGDAGTLAAQNDAFLRYCEANGYQPAAAFLDPVPGAGAERRIVRVSGNCWTTWTHRTRGSSPSS